MEKKKKFLIKIRPLLLGSLILLISSVIAVTLSLQYYFQKELAFEATKDNFKHISEKLEQNIKSIDDRNNSIISMFELYKDVTKVPQENIRHPLLPLLANIIEQNNFIHAIYVGHKNGDFYEVINLDMDKSIKKRYKLTENYRWQIIKIFSKNGKRVRYEEFLDKDFNQLMSLNKAAFYNPSVRPWYKEAIKAKDHIIKTAPYMFSNLEEHGITYARSINNNESVIGVDVSLSMLSNFLKTQQTHKNHEIYLFRGKGKITASTKTKKTIKPRALYFTKEEQEFIKNSDIIKVPNEKNYPPFDFMINGEPKGFSIDILKLISKKTGLRFEYVKNKSWDELLTMYKNKEIQLFHTISKNRKRVDLGIFSSSYKNLKIQLLINKNEKEIKRLNDVNGRTLGVIKGFDIEEFISSYYPKIKMVYVESTLDGLQRLSKGELDAFIERDLIAEYHIKQNHLENLLFINSIKELEGKESQGTHFLTFKELPLLASIIQKTLNSISKEELDVLNKKWFSDSVKTETIPYQEVIDLSLKNGYKLKYESLNIKNKEYFVYISKLDSIYPTKEYVAMIIPVDYIMQPYSQKIWSSFFITLGILTFIVPFIWVASKMISDPIDKLEKENEKIKRREFLNVQNVETSIQEIDDLSHSLTDMSESIREYQHSQEELLNAFTKIIASAIDAKSTYTGEHCKRVPILTMMIAQKAHAEESGIFKEFSINSEDQRRELNIAAWLHDCGKVTTPEYVIDKATKLETIYNRIHEIRTRFEVIHRDLTIKTLQNIIKGADEKGQFEELHKEHDKLKEEYEVIANANIGAEFMSEEEIKKLELIAQKTWTRNFDNSIGISFQEKERQKGNETTTPHIEKLLDDKKEHIIKREEGLKKEYDKYNFKVDIPKHLYNLGELYNLRVKKGTLTEEERFKIKEHIMITIIMLEQLPFPKNLKNIPEYAAAHHETLIGTGYPRKLKKEDMSIPARILALADIFEALTSPDRPYKKGKTLSETLNLIHKMVQNKELDEDIFKLFIRSGIYKEYGRLFLHEDQLDEIDTKLYL